MSVQIGKVPNNILKEIIFNKLKKKRSEVIVRPKIGEDCCGVDFGDNICVLSSDPITGTANDIGRLSVHISCNDIASCGVEPIGLLVTVLLPAGSKEEELDTIMTQLSETADQLNVDIIGGHTEITDTVSRVVIVSTAVGRATKKGMVTSSGARPGDFVVMTKFAGIEGTAIIAAEKESELASVFGEEFVKTAKSYIEDISVVKEGVLAGKFGVSAMHDVTEGGVLGAVWEIAEASQVGVSIIKKDIPVKPETEKICEFYNINPLKLISSGCMIITCGDGKGLIKELSRNGIDAGIIGKVTDEEKRVIVDGNSIEDILQPESDELYKVI